MYIYCDRPSLSARALRINIPAKRAREGDFTNIGELIINWGCSTLYVKTGFEVNLLNHPEAVRKAADKLLFFQAMDGLGLTPPFYTTSAEASEAISRGKTIVCRTILNGHSGGGIVISPSIETLVPAKLYVEYVKKETEWRVHVFAGKVIDVQRKARNRATPNDQVNWQIRSHANGFNYIRGDINDFPSNFIHHLSDVSVRSVGTLGLDFGAVDLIATKDGRIYVLEVNTAPGLEETTLDNYVKAIQTLSYTNK